MRVPLDVGGDTRRYVAEATARGFVWTLLSDKIRHFDGIVYLNRLVSHYDTDRALIARELLKLQGKKYGFGDLFRNLSGPVKLDGKEVFCSEALQLALIRAKLIDDDFNDGLSLVPGEFQKTGLYLKPIKIHEGR